MLFKRNKINLPLEYFSKDGYKYKLMNNKIYLKLFHKDDYEIEKSSKILYSIFLPMHSIYFICLTELTHHFMFMPTSIALASLPITLGISFNMAFSSTDYDEPVITKYEKDYKNFPEPTQYSEEMFKYYTPLEIKEIFISQLLQFKIKNEAYYSFLDIWNIEGLLSNNVITFKEYEILLNNNIFVSSAIQNLILLNEAPQTNLN